ncbi:unnamed protein product [Hymenolepis diminuta]|uniref:Uncharacterized protein n=1 Tax=Hymenolepis diminuta TaxID=6216 RepID=A0A564Z9X1_HYMDI|nr:unnamed protein product [Hymenolepis diminuta]
MPFISVFTWESRDVLNISHFIATRCVHTPIRTSFFVALAADQIFLTFFSSILQYFTNHILSFKQHQHFQFLRFTTYLPHKNFAQASTRALFWRLCARSYNLRAACGDIYSMPPYAYFTSASITLSKA